LKSCDLVTLKELNFGNLAMGESFVFKMTLNGESEERLDKFNDFEAFVK